MSAGKIYRSTLKFVWMKLLLGVAVLVVSLILALAGMEVSRRFGGEYTQVIMTGVWFAGTVTAYIVLVDYIGFMVKAGHVAVIAAAAVTGHVPEHQFEEAKKVVRERFVTAHVYYVIEKLTRGAMSQLQNGITRLEEAVESIPGAGTATEFAGVFVEIALGYIDDCCLAYVCCMPGENAYSCAADAVAIYTLNWKRLLKCAAELTVFVILGTAILIVVCLFGFYGIFTMLAWPVEAGVILGLVVAAILKAVFLDSYVMVRMIAAFMSSDMHVTGEFHERLCKISRKFDKLVRKGKK